jgi:hypothetical protein
MTDSNMYESDYDPDTDEWEDDWEGEEAEEKDEQWNEDEEQDEEDTEEELDGLTRRHREAEETSARNKKFAKENLSKSEAEVFLEHGQVDIDKLRREVEELKEESRKEREDIKKALDSGEINEFHAEVLEHRIRQKEKGMRWKLTLASASMTPDTIPDLMDDYYHIAEDSLNPELREIRKDIRKEMEGMSYSQKKSFIDNLYENHRISDEVYSRLIIELL